MSLRFDSGDVLLAVDPQRDFCPGGALAVPEGDAIFEVLNRAAREAPLVVASRDWHPRDHLSFAGRGGQWPPHCVAGSEGADFHPAFAASEVDHVVSKGIDPEREAYSAFDATDLAQWLRAQGARRLVVGGLATDYCVRATVLDALREGFKVVVLAGAVRPVDLAPGDGERALEEMRAAGAEVREGTDG